MKENAAVKGPVPFAVHVLSKQEKAISARQKAGPNSVAETASESQAEFRSVHQPKPVQSELPASPYGSMMLQFQLAGSLREPKDAYLTGAKRSLQRRLLGLNLTSPQSALSGMRSLAKRA